MPACSLPSDSAALVLLIAYIDGTTLLGPNWRNETNNGKASAPTASARGGVKTRGPAHCRLEEVRIATAIDRASKTGFARVPSLESFQNGRSHAHVWRSARAQVHEQVEPERHQRSALTARQGARRGRMVAGYARRTQQF